MKRTLYWTFVCLGGLCLLDFILILSKRMAFHIGTASLLIIGLSLIGYGSWKLAKRGMIFKNRWVSGIATICIVLLLGSFIIIESFIWSSTRDESNVKVDYVILLGAGLQGDTIPETFKNRIDKCVTYLKANPKAIVVVSGGQGIGETITEAEAMKQYLIKKRISPDRILTEQKATSTFENLSFSKDILDRVSGQDEYTVLIATNDFHLFRSKMLAKRLGLMAYGMPADTWWGSFPSNCIREYFAVMKSCVVDR